MARPRLADDELTHLRRFGRFVDLSPGDPLRMLAVAVISLAKDDAEAGHHVQLDRGWLSAAQVPDRALAALALMHVEVVDNDAERCPECDAWLLGCNPNDWPEHTHSVAVAA